MKISPAEMKVLMNAVRQIARNHASRKKRAEGALYPARKVKEGLDKDMNDLLHLIVSMVTKELDAQR